MYETHHVVARRALPDDTVLALGASEQSPLKWMLPFDRLVSFNGRLLRFAGQRTPTFGSQRHTMKSIFVFRVQSDK
jgi:hypothetical protein